MLESIQEIALSFTSITSNGNSYDFPTDLPVFPGPAFGWVLIATADFAALPGAPTPDYVIPANFFDPAGDTITYNGAPDVAVLAPGALPTDGVQSLHRDITSGVMTAGPNSPTNYARVTGSVSPPVAVPTGLGWTLALALGIASVWGVRRRALTHATR